MAVAVELLLNVGLPLTLLIVAYVVGSYLENRHFQDIRRRERANEGFLVVNCDTVPSHWTVESVTLVSGSVVVSLDYFKRIIAGLRGLIGGRVRTYEPLLDRARREAMLRMVEAAREGGYDAIINVRLETSRLANTSRGGSSTAGVEMLAFGTALARAPRPSGR